MKRVVLFIFIMSVFIFLIYTVSPSVNSGDSGEFITTSITLGIAHSPGYPLYSLVGKIFSYIIPFGNYAYRINLMNTVFVIFVIVILFSFANNRNISSNVLDIINILSTIGVLIFSKSFWRNSVQTEVFILNVLFVVLIIFILFLPIKFVKKWCLISFLFGISLGNHHTIVFLLPGLVYLFFSSKSELTNLWKDIFLFIIFFVIGISVYTILPLRSQKNPGLDWGNTEKIVNLYRVITRKDYGTFQLTVEKPLPRNFVNIVQQVKRYIKHTLNDIPLAIVILCILGIVIVYNEDKNKCFALSTTLFLCGIGFFILSNLPFEPIHDGILERFYIFPNTIVCIFTLLFITSKKNFFSTKLRKVFLTIVLLLCFVWNITKNYPFCNLRSYYLNYDYGMNILRTIVPNGILFMDGGDDTFYTLAYLQFAEGRRKDISLHDRGGVVFKNIYGEDFRQLTKEEKEIRRQQIESSFLSRRTVYYSTFNKNILPKATLFPVGALYKAVPKDTREKIFPHYSFEFYSLRSVYQEYDDYRSKALCPIYDFIEATNIEPIQTKIDLLKYTYLRWPEVDWLKNNVSIELHNLGYKMFNEGDYNITEKIYKFLIYINPKDIYALLNLGVTYERLGKLDLAEQTYNTASKIDPTNPNTYYNLAVLYWKKNDWDNVIKYFNKVLQLQPDNKEVKNFLLKAEIEKNKLNK